MVTKARTRIERLEGKMRSKSDFDLEAAKQHLRDLGSNLGFLPGFGVVRLDDLLSVEEWCSKFGIGQPIDDITEIVGNA